MLPKIRVNSWNPWQSIKMSQSSLLNRITLLDMLAGGSTEQEILQDFPYLETSDIRACLEYAAAL
jgi:hypothetical protein